MSTAPGIEATTIVPGESARDQLRARGVPDSYATRWGQLGPLTSATLWSSGGQAVLETHRVASGHRTISGCCLLDDTETAGQACDERARWEELIRAVVDSSPDSPLIKAVSRRAGSCWEEALSACGFVPVGAVGSPLSIEEDCVHGHARVRGWVRWGVPARPVPPYVRQKTEFTCGPASVLMAVANVSGAAPGQVGHGLAEEMELWRESTYSLGVGPYGLAASLARCGLAVDLLVTRAGPVVGVTRACVATPAVRRAIHDMHAHEARELGVRDRVGSCELSDLRDALTEGRSALVLVDLETLNGEQTPHWVYVWALVGEHALVHDPWNDEQRGETWVETWTQAITLERLWAAARWTEDEEARAYAIVTPTSLPSLGR